MNRLDVMKEEDSFVPKAVFWDYPDLMLPSDRSIKEKRLAIQRVFYDIINFNKRRQIASFGVSQVIRQAFDKKVIRATDIGEDFGKIANAHGVFALCRTAEEKAEGLGRLEPLVQRMGVSSGKGRSVVLRIDESRMIVEEQSYADAVKRMQDRVAVNVEDE